MKQAVLGIEHRLSQRSLGGCVLAVLVAGSALAQSTPARFLVSSAQIIAAMQSRQLPTEGVQVEISAPITASVAEPPLEIQTIALLTARTAQIKIACRNHTECLPFYVSASWPEASIIPAIPTSIRKPVESIKAEAPQQQPLLNASLLRPEASKTEQPQTVHAGTSAMLLMDKDRIHIRVRVICLEGGTAGDRVRVTTPDHKQAYVAEIVSPTLLKGSF